MTKTRAELALGYRCKDCGAKKGDPCVYVPIKETSPLTPTARDRRRYREALTGTPTLRPHNARFAAIRTAKPKRPAPTQSPVMAAVRQFDVQEYDAMRAWLTQNVGILL